MKLELDEDTKNLSLDQKSQIIKNLANDFYIEYDLFKIADLYILCNSILKSNKFPLKAYKKYYKKSRNCIL